jgi:hypothetical protein
MADTEDFHKWLMLYKVSDYNAEQEIDSMLKEAFRAGMKRGAELFGPFSLNEVVGGGSIPLYEAFDKIDKEIDLGRKIA